MKRISKWAVFAVSIAWLLTMLGCGKEKPYMLDGPGMEYQSPWTAFTLSKVDGNTQNSYWFTVIDDGERVLVTGGCCDENGNSYIEEAGIEVSAKDLWQLRWMDLDKLPDEEPWTEDMARITLTLTLSDGSIEEKYISSDISTEIYEILLPYMKNKYNIERKMNHGSY